MGSVTDNLNVVPQTIVKFPPLLLANWARKVETESTYNTVVSQAVDGKESRSAITVRPQRFLMVRLSAFNTLELARLNAMMLRMANQIVPVPVYSDIKIVSDITTNVVTIDNTAYTRFQTNARVAVFYVASIDEEVQSVEYFTISSLASTTITLSGSPSAIPSGQFAYIVPTIDCEIRLTNQRINMNTDRVAYVDAPFKEYFDESALRPEGGYVPSLFQSEPVFEFEHNWRDDIKIDVRAIGQSTPIGKTEFKTVQGIRPLHRFTLKSMFCDREEAFKMVSFFDYVKGRLAPFWYVSPTELWEVSSTFSDSVYLEPNGLSVDDIKDNYSYMYVNDALGNRTITQIIEVVSESGKIRVITGNYFPSSTTYTVASPVHYSRFGRDSLREVWTTDGVCEISYTIQEILEDPPSLGFWGGNDIVNVVDGYWGGDESTPVTDGFSGGSE